jgi:FHA domain
MITCPKCACENTGDSNFCRRCGTHLLPLEAAEITLGYTMGDREEGRVPGAGEADVISGTVLLIRAGGDREGEIVYLGQEVLTIGRSPQSDLFLDDVTVSRHHARIVNDADGFLIEDLNSLNGTYVNRKRIERHQLFDGDELQIGKFKLAFLQQREGV